MIAERPINISEEYRKIALKGEPILDNSQNLVIISMQNYEEMVKAKHNAEYTAKLQRGISALNAGKGIEHEIIEDYDE